VRRIVYWLSLALIFTVPWEGAFHLPGLGTAATVMGLIVGGCWVVMVGITGRMRAPIPFLAIVSIFVGWVTITTFWSADPTESMGMVARWLQTFVLVLILWDLYRTQTALLHGLQAYVLGTYIAVGGAVFNFLHSRAFYTNYERYALGDTNPDGYGFILALGIPVACYLAASPTTPRFLRFINYGYLPVAFLGIALSGTRTAAVAATVGLLYGLATFTRLRFLTRLAVVALLGTALFLILPIVQPLPSFQRLGTTATEVTQGDLNGRTSQWRQGLRAFVDHPVIGVGTNMYRSVNTLDKVAHNSYLSILVELGLIGFALFAIILWAVAHHAWILDRWDRRFWFTVLAVWAIGASTLTWEHRKTTWLFFTFTVAASAVLDRARAPVEDVVDLREEQERSALVPAHGWAR
jgi:O-antigen ligase